MASLLLALLARSRGQVTSGSQFSYWLTSCLCQGLALGSAALRPESPHTRLTPVLSVLSLSFSLIVLLLSCWADPPPLYVDLSSKSSLSLLLISNVSIQAITPTTPPPSTPPPPSPASSLAGILSPLPPALPPPGLSPSSSKAGRSPSAWRTCGGWTGTRVTRAWCRGE